MSYLLKFLVIIKPFNFQIIKKPLIRRGILTLNIVCTIDCLQECIASIKKSIIFKNIV